MAAAALFSSAQSLFGTSKLAGNYAINGGPGTSSSGPSYTTQAGLWTVQKATHKSNGKAVCIWTLDKGTLSSAGKGKMKLDATLEVLKKEVSMLSRLRHPCVLEVVEPLEETRSSLTFATEPVSGTLRTAINASEQSSRFRRGSAQEADQMGDLDEIEIQKGLLQIGKALQFLHESAKLVHSNLTPDAIVVNAKGDWKLSGFGLSTYLTSRSGQAVKWDFPAYDRSLPQAVQKDFDYMAPEYALDETLIPANDMYALGCIIFAIHTKSGPPFANKGNLQNLRDNMENLMSIRASWHRLGDEVQDVLSQLLTRYPSTRFSAVSFQSSRYFSSILVSTLRFLDRDNFAAKPREEQASFLKGLLKVLPQFSDKVIKRKILPSLVEETRKTMLVPFLLPCIFYIGQKMDNEEFKEMILPSIKPLFTVKDPPQTLLTLLDSLKLFHEKCNAATFRDEVLPLIYNALDSEIAPVLEKALKVIPELSEALDYTTVKSLLLPKITNVFSKTTSLAVKITTLLCFKSLVPVLDKFTLTEKLVPLLARIKTKEPGVMIATLAVHEQIGLKCDIEAIATLVLPQLWAMSITPLLSAEQFRRFMNVIKQLGSRVEEEHSRHLAEIKRLEETSGAASNGRRGTLTADGQNGNGEVDFEALVRGGSGQGSQRSVTPDPFGATDDFAKFDNLSLASSSQPSPSSSTLSPPMLHSSSSSRTPMRLDSSRNAPTSSSKAASILGARPISAAAYQTRNGMAITPDSSAPNTPPAFQQQQQSFGALPPPMSMSQPQASRNASNNSFTSSSMGGPNYNTAISPQVSSNALATTSNGFMQPLQPSTSSYLSQPSLTPSSSYMSSMQPASASSASSSSHTHALSPAIQWNNAPPLQPAINAQPAPVQWGQAPARPQQQAPPGFGSILQPTKKETSYDWADFDPMR